MKNPARLLRRSLPSVNGPGNVIRDTWDRMHKIPGGKRLFSRFLGMMVPYTGSISARIEHLSIGKSEVTMEDRSRLRNHLKSVHAVALVNLAELAGNLAVVYSMPDDARFIVAGLEIEYLKKARGTITARCSVDPPKTSERQEYFVPVEMFDSSGETVATAKLRTLVGPKNQKSNSSSS